MATSLNCAAFMHNKMLKIHRHKHLELLAFWLYCRHVWACHSSLQSLLSNLWVQTHHLHLLSRCLSAVMASWQPHNSHCTMHKIYTMPLHDSPAILAFHWVMNPFFWTFRKHLSQTISPSIYPHSLNQSKLRYCQFLIFNLKLSRFTEGTWKRVLK